MARRLLAALLAGGASVFAFAPFDLFPLAFLGLGALAWLLGGVARWRTNISPRALRGASRRAISCA